MKRLWIGVILLAVLLGLGIATTVWAGSVHAGISRKLDQAGQAAMAEDWAGAGRYASRAKAEWDRSRNATAAIGDHEPMEEIDSLFQQLEVYLEMQDAVGFSACCAALHILTDAMGEAHAVNWWNLL